MSPNLMVKDIKASHEFYTMVLGFKLLDQEPKNADAVWMMFSYNDITIMIQSTESITEEIPQLKSEHTGGTLTFYITISDINSYYKKVSESAKEYRQELRSESPSLTSWSDYTRLDE